MQKRNYTRILGILSFILFYITTAAQNSHPLTDDEFIGPFPSWVNVKTQFGAVGDGIHDDSDAIQLALNLVGTYTKKASVVYLPPGTYRITRTLIVSAKNRMGLVGADPSNTMISWDGENDGTMIYINGVEHSRFNRISWQGNNKAKIAVDQSWDGFTGYFDSGNEFADDIFSNVKFGIYGGYKYGRSFAEITIMRCKFRKNTTAGISLGNFNALDIWVWNSEFDDCAIGITNTINNGAGGFKVYNSIFRRSTEADIKIGNTVEFSFRDNTSINSKTFLYTNWSPNPASIIIQGNKIIDPLDSVVIRVQNQGQVTMLDNTIRSRAGVVGPVVVVDGPPTTDFFAIGNTFTVSNPIKGEKNIILNSTIATRASLGSLVEQTLPGAEPNRARRIFEVPVGATFRQIQAIIDQAQAYNGQRPVVHIPCGLFYIDSTITIPKNSDVQLVGDSYWSILMSRGTYAGPLLRIEGPTKSTIRDLMFNGNKTSDGILVENVDQVGSRIFTHKSESHNNKINYHIKGLDRALVLLTNIGYTQASERAFVVEGSDLAKAGNPVQSRTIIYGGLGYDNKLTFDVSNGVYLLARDTWYESKYKNKFLKLDKNVTFSVEGSHIQNHDISVINDFSGKALFLTSYISNKIQFTGDISRGKFLGLGLHSGNDNYLADHTNITPELKLINTRSSQHPSSNSGSNPMANIGSVSNTEYVSMLEQVRETHTSVIKSLPNGVSDLRMFRTFVEYANVGIKFESNDEFTVLENLNVPIYVSQLSAGNELKWILEDAKKYEYEIEQSTDGKKFSPIGRINKGSVKMPNALSWLHQNPRADVNFYRVKIASSTGKSRYTHVVTAGTANQNMKVYPNPVIGNAFAVKLNNIPKGDLIVQLSNQSGQRVYQKKITHPGGYLDLSISLNVPIPTGIYSVQVKSETFSVAQSIQFNSL